MSAASDLFGAPPVPGLALGEAAVSPAEEAELIARIDAAGLSPFRFQQWTGKRLTRSYGWTYDFEKGGFAPADPIPPWLAAIRQRAAHFAGLEGDALVQALVIRYDPGAGIGWHRDRPVFEHVVGLSLGSPSAMRLRRRTASGFERRSVPLAPRSLYHLAGEVRHGWEHSLAPLERPRRSVTFRSLAAAWPVRGG